MGEQFHLYSFAAVGNHSSHNLRNQTTVLWRILLLLLLLWLSFFLALHCFNFHFVIFPVKTPHSSCVSPGSHHLESDTVTVAQFSLDR